MHIASIQRFSPYRDNGGIGVLLQDLGAQEGPSSLAINIKDAYLRGFDVIPPSVR